MAERLDQIKLRDGARPEISNGDVAKCVIALLCCGKTDFADIEPLRDNFSFKQSLGLKKVPSEATIRQRLDEAEGKFDAVLLDVSSWLVAKFAPYISPCHGDLVPLDIDVSVFDNSNTKKEGVGWTYQHLAGYSPIFAYVGLEGYLAHLQLREGSQHCQKGTPEFLRETIHLLRRYNEFIRLLLRNDSGNDSHENIKVCIEEKIEWLIKRNLRQESPEGWLLYAQDHGEGTSPREGKQVWQGERWTRVEGIEQPLRIVYEVIRRTIDHNGQYLVIPKLDVATYWTSLNLPPDQIGELYHQHGTSEQFHSEIKSDMDLERLPSGKFSTNWLFLLLGMLAYNILRILGQEALRGDYLVELGRKSGLRKPIQCRRLRNVIMDLMYLGCQVIRHARQVIFSFGVGEAWYPVWERIYRRVCTAPAIMRC